MSLVQRGCGIHVVKAGQRRADPVAPAVAGDYTEESGAWRSLDPGSDPLLRSG